MNKKQSIESSVEMELKKHIKLAFTPEYWPEAKLHLAIISSVVADYLSLRRAPARGTEVNAWTSYIAGQNRKIDADNWLQSDECRELATKLGLSYSYLLSLIAKAKKHSLIDFPEYTKAEKAAHRTWRQEAQARARQKKAAA